MPTESASSSQLVRRDSPFPGTGGLPLDAEEDAPRMSLSLSRSRRSRGARCSGGCCCMPLTFCVLLAVFAGTLAAAVVTWRHYSSLRDTDLWVNRACMVLSAQVRSLDENQNPQREPGRRFRAEARVRPVGVTLPANTPSLLAFWGRDGAYGQTKDEATHLVSTVHPGALAGCFARRSEPLRFSMARVPRVRAPTEDVFLNMAWGSSFFAAISGFLVIALCANIAQRGLIAALGPEGVVGEPDIDSKKPVCLTSVQARYIMHRFAESACVDAWTCSICLDDEEKGAPTRSVVLPCGHRYHARCLRRWLRRGAPTCPLCNWNVAALFDEAGEPLPEDQVVLASLGKPEGSADGTPAPQEMPNGGGSVTVNIGTAELSGAEDEFEDIAVPEMTAETHP